MMDHAPSPHEPRKTREQSDWSRCITTGCRITVRLISMRRSTIVAFCLVPLLASAGFVLWISWPSIQGRREIAKGIAAINSHDLKTPIREQRVYGANTFTNECESITIQHLYDRAARSLAGRFPEVHTYSWIDTLGWDRVSTVAQGSDGYVEVRASCNNDNDSLSIRFCHGTFAQEGSKLLTSTDLPKGTLRCEWPQNQQ